MGRAPCCDKANVKKGPWSPEEDAKLKDYIQQHGTGGNWIALPNKVGLKRCGKSCRLRWLNYLRPNIKHGEFSDAEDKIICSLFASIGTRWSIIASQLPGRTDNDIKNYWNTKLKKKMMAIHRSAESYKPQQVALSSTLQNSTPPSSLLFTDSSSNNNFTASGSFSYSSTTTSSLLSENSSTSVPANPIFQAQESFNIGPTQKCQFKDSNISNFVLGGEATSCSSSDGSCNNNQVSHVIEQELGDHASFVEQIGAVNYLYNGEKLMLSNSGSADGWTEKQNGLWGENPLDYGLEEIKQLISTNSTTCNNNFLFDDKKTEENVMYY